MKDFDKDDDDKKKERPKKVKTREDADRLRPLIKSSLLAEKLI